MASARLGGMQTDLNLDNQEWATGISILFVGCVAAACAVALAHTLTPPTATSCCRFPRRTSCSGSAARASTWASPSSCGAASAPPPPPPTATRTCSSSASSSVSSRPPSSRGACGIRLHSLQHALTPVQSPAHPLQVVHKDGALNTHGYPVLWLDHQQCPGWPHRGWHPRRHGQRRWHRRLEVALHPGGCRDDPHWRAYFCAVSLLRS